jgi:hypothetical protein
VPVDMQNLREFSKKIEMTSMLLSEIWGKMIYEKKQKKKSRDTAPLKTKTRPPTFSFLLFCWSWLMVHDVMADFLQGLGYLLQILLHHLKTFYRRKELLLLFLVLNCAKKSYPTRD